MADIAQVWSLIEQHAAVDLVPLVNTHFGDQASYDLAASGLAVSGDSANELFPALDLPQCVAAEAGGSA